jgi:dehydrogenase/reductase SDR family protein 4
VDEALAQLRGAGIEAVGCAANVGSKPDLARLVALAAASWGGVDVLVSNAAVNPAAGLILDMPDTAIDKILDVNVKSAILLARETRPHLRKACAAPASTPLCCSAPACPFAASQPLCPAG